MDKPTKIALIGFLVCLLFTLIVLLDGGFFALPYPMFSYILFAVVAATMWQDKAEWILYVPMLLLIVLRCINNPMTFSFFMDEAQYEAYAEGSFPEIFGGLELLSNILLCITLFGIKEWKFILVGVGLSCGFIGLLVVPNPLFRFVFFSFVGMAMMLMKPKSPTLPSLILLAIFDLMQGYSVFLS